MRRIIDLSYVPRKKEEKEESPLIEAFILVIFGVLFAWMLLAAVVGRINIF